MEFEVCIMMLFEAKLEEIGLLDLEAGPMVWLNCFFLLGDALAFLGMALALTNAEFLAGTVRFIIFLEFFVFNFYLLATVKNVC